MPTILNRRGRPPHPDILTPSEWLVLDGVRAGRTNREIASELGVTFHTVKFHIATSMTLTFGGARRLADRSQPHDEAPLESGDWTITVPLD